jgi:hypothetical protein
MPLRNRVSPLGELLAEPGRGLVYGNRGCLHDASGRIRRRWNGRRWIACRLEFRGARRPLTAPGRYTGLFFLDEATALAAGHRPCALCRGEDYRRFVAHWQELHPGAAGADAIDARLHAERLSPLTRAQLHHRAPLAGLPDGAFVLLGGAAHVLDGGRLLPWTAGGYGLPVERPAEVEVTVITPPSLVSLLGSGWHPVVPLLHPSALGGGAASRRRATAVGERRSPGDSPRS